jgi:hypothetical protein
MLPALSSTHPAFPEITFSLPTNEAAVLGLTGEIVEPLGKGAGVLVVDEADRTRVEPLA